MTASNGRSETMALSNAAACISGKRFAGFGAERCVGECSRTSFLRDVLHDRERQLVLAVLRVCFLDALRFFLGAHGRHNGVAVIKQGSEDVRGDEAGAACCRSSAGLFLSRYSRLNMVAAGLPVRRILVILAICPKLCLMFYIFFKISLQVCTDAAVVLESFCLSIASLQIPQNITGAVTIFIHGFFHHHASHTLDAIASSHPPPPVPRSLRPGDKLWLYLPLPFDRVDVRPTN